MTEVRHSSLRERLDAILDLRERGNNGITYIVERDNNERDI